MDKQAKLKQFANDRGMNLAVYQVLFDAFIKKSTGPQDVYLLAAARLSMDFLEQAWKEIDSYKNTKEITNNGLTQVGL